ncbi:hypothetical protein AMC87_CH01953 [Rhizobium phaseoli]|uniref:Uncharacterized protein n=1 Tax=Rhizobium etli (strain CIAT 652) TaxID=491916 RepID=B3PYM3_RHIE6|nr:hypothetical protein RHECIAT_CH0001991 [Rhizobium etli CIAT 652]ANL46636.1 hypothetical protein AMC87_CH01953 [Rhizobium phaseoli]ARM12245.1 hypothetical protein Bra5_CH02019 [Rhizobium phaseoli Brasil 5]KKZ89463.1 hypothetical protein RPHASCH2410_CH02370 [Rhizobium phaseoli Ch24-10]
MSERCVRLPNCLDTLPARVGLSQSQMSPWSSVAINNCGKIQNFGQLRRIHGRLVTKWASDCGKITRKSYFSM